MLLQLLQNYKEELIEIGIDYKQKKFLNESFSRWYVLCDKIEPDGIFPNENIMNISDLKYANNNKNTEFNIDKIITKSDNLIKKYKALINLEKTEKQNSEKIEKTNSEKEINPGKTENIITKKQFDRLIKLYIHDHDFEKNYKKLVSLYQLIGINNMQLSIPPIFSGVELFGSPFNTHNKEYCSLFAFEKIFNSLGSFWKYNFHKDGIYLCNPPFDNTIIERMSKKLIEDINNTKHEIIVVITIPVWNTESQKILGIKDYNMDFEGYYSLMNSQYLKNNSILNKNKYQYWNYYTEEKVSVSYTHLIILSNMSNIKYKYEFDIENFMRKWENF